MRPAFRPVLVLLAIFALCQPASADNTAQTLPFSQDWTNIGLITANDNWSGVPGIEGFRGDDLTGGTGTDPQTLLAADDPGVLDVNANQTDPEHLRHRRRRRVRHRRPGRGAARAPARPTRPTSSST